MVRSSNSSTRRSSDSPSGAQYGIDVEESMVTDTGEEIHKHGPPDAQLGPRLDAKLGARLVPVVGRCGVEPQGALGLREK